MTTFPDGCHLVPVIDVFLNIQMILSHVNPFLSPWPPAGPASFVLYLTQGPL